MITKETDYLKLLKVELEEKYMESYPECSLKITDWRQQEINRFQDLMQNFVKGRISEKWFYTHIKPEVNTKMPRVDTLNLLSEFLGYKNWLSFKKEKGGYTKSENNNNQKKSFIYRNRILLSIILFVIIVAGLAFSAGVFTTIGNYEFCFIDADTQEQIEHSDIEVTILHSDQSPETINCNDNACFEVDTKEKKICFSVKALYYKTVTITRVLTNKSSSETIKLKQDDYALLIHIFSTSNLTDWKKQRDRLNKMIADHAEIYQIDKNERGVEIYNKNEFIDKMTIPLSSLKNIEIIEVSYENDKIAMMRFIQK